MLPKIQGRFAGFNRPRALLGGEMLDFGGKWSEEKLGVLRKYLTAYNKVLSGTNFRRYYIDTFAGAGGQVVGRDHSTTQELLPIGEMRAEGRAFLEGSARIALQTAPAFHQFIFSDLKKQNSEKLRQLKLEFPTKAIDVRQGDANDVLLATIKDVDWRVSRAVVFLDPFGGQVKWTTLEAIAATGGIDLWYLFPSGLGVLRQIPKHGKIRGDIDRLLTALFGTESWKEKFLKPNPQLGLLDNLEQNPLRTVSIESIERFLVSRLRVVFGEGTVDKCLTLYSTTHAPMYSLCFAAANRGRGGQIATKIARSLIVGKGAKGARR